MTGSPSFMTDKILKAAGVILILVALCATWSIPHGSGDLYISLAAGHDVLAGKLGAPDDWSFSTEGRVWINQNWGADVILYLVESALGGTGLLALKFLLLVLSALFIFLALHERKIKPVINLIITSAVIVSVNMYAVLRPNLFTLPLAALELFLLYKSEKSFFYVWMVVPVILLWANLHAGFIFGLGMLFLWAVYKIVPELWRRNRGVLERSLHLPAAIAAAMVLAGLLNPFGLTNLTHPFTMVRGSEWKTTLDWLPIWDKGLPPDNMSSILSFLVLVCTTLLLLCTRLFQALLRKKSHNEKKDAGALRPRKQMQASMRDSRIGGSEGPYERPEGGGVPLQITLFEATLALVTFAMAVLSNRFIILALVALAPFLARQLEWLCRIFRYYRLLLIATYGFVLVFGMLILYDNVRSYDPRNPVMNLGTGTLFEKMHFTNKLYGAELIRFINTNRISGKVYSPWTWEGIIRRSCPQLKPFIGGRAQQIYSIEAYNKYMYASGYDVPAYRGKPPTDVLDSIGAHYLIAANAQDSQNIVLTALNAGNWIVIYADEKWLLFADNNAPNASAAINLMTEDKLIFENEPTRAMSKAASRLSRISSWHIESLLPLFAEAWKYEPGWLWSYWILYNNLGFNAEFLQELAQLMEEQLSRLEGMSLEGADAGDILRCRIYLASALEEYAKSRGLGDMAAELRSSLDTASELEAALYGKWKAITR